jgi:hypothetical protein
VPAKECLKPIDEKSAARESVTAAAREGFFRHHTSLPTHGAPPTDRKPESTLAVAGSDHQQDKKLRQDNFAKKIANVNMSHYLQRTSFLNARQLDM